MSWMLTRKGKIQTLVHLFLPLSQNPSMFPIQTTMMGWSTTLVMLRLDMFQNERFPPDDPDIDEYRNILKSDIHMIVSHPELFPYNDASIWCFSYL
jgi:hypothetical protein